MEITVCLLGLIVVVLAYGFLNLNSRLNKLKKEFSDLNQALGHFCDTGDVKERTLTTEESSTLIQFQEELADLRDKVVKLSVRQKTSRKEAP
jgi:uncharacterized protein (DUF342 family)